MLVKVGVDFAVRLVKETMIADFDQGKGPG